MRIYRMGGIKVKENPKSKNLCKLHSAERDNLEVTHTTLLSLSMVPPLIIPLLYALWVGNR